MIFFHKILHFALLHFDLTNGYDVKLSKALSRNLREKTVTSNMSISNLENFNLQNESGELEVSRELKDGMTQYRFQQFFETNLTRPDLT